MKITGSRTAPNRWALPRWSKNLTDRLLELRGRVKTVKGWEKLLSTPPPSPPNNFAQSWPAAGAEREAH